MNRRMRADAVANILLVDDDPENPWALQIALEGDGDRVSVAGDARRALDILRREPIELLITDREMPGIDGVQFCRIVRSQPDHCALPIILLSGAPEPNEKPPPWNRFFRKPARLEVLVAVVQAAIDAYSAARLSGPVGGQNGMRVSARAPIACMRGALACQHLPAWGWAPVRSECWP